MQTISRDGGRGGGGVVGERGAVRVRVRVKVKRRQDITRQREQNN